VIIDAIVTAFLAALDALLSLIPDLIADDYDDNGAFSNNVFFLTSQITRVFPLGFFVVGMVMFLTVTLGLALWDLTLWVYHQLWGSA
jgi:hypothetical protein